MIETLWPLVKLGFGVFLVCVGIYVCLTLARIQRRIEKANQLLELIGFSAASIDKNTELRDIRPATDRLET